MNPFFFGPSARRVFGVYDVPADSTRDVGIVLCPPIGGEYLCAHPTYRLLARLLAASGYHVLRLDYYGTGDAYGEFEETHQAQWLADIELAITEIRDLARVSRIGLVGMRYGATLAAQVARRRDDVDCLVLWDAIVDGRTYLAEIGAGDDAGEAVVDVSGVGMCAQARRDIAGVTLATFAAPLPRTLVSTTAPASDGPSPLVERLAGQRIDVSVRQDVDVRAWLEGPLGRLALPVPTVQAVVTWLS